MKKDTSILRMLKKHNSKFLSKFIFVLLFSLTIAIASLVTVSAINIPCIVEDEDQTYSFNLIAPEIDSIVNQAIEHGMEPLGVHDIVEEDQNKLIIRRSINVEIQYDENNIEVIANTGDTVAYVLEKSGVYYPEDARVSMDEDEVLTSDTKILIDSLKTVTVNNDGKDIKVEIYSGTVKDAAVMAGQVDFNESVEITPAIDEQIKDGMYIQIVKTSKIMFVDGIKEPVEYITTAATVEDFIAENNIQAGESDFFDCELDQAIDGIETIRLNRVTFSTFRQTEVILYDTVYEDDDTMYVGATKLKSNGSNGEQSVLYSKRYVNGEYVDSQVSECQVRKEAVSRVVYSGTKEIPEGETPALSQVSNGNTFTDQNGHQTTYVNKIIGECTAYSAPGGLTSTGRIAQYGVVAVNPKQIAYGTRLFITSADGSIVYGYAVAGDTGGAMLNYQAMIDLHYETEAECWQFGRRDMVIYVLE